MSLKKVYKYNIQFMTMYYYNNVSDFVLRIFKYVFRLRQVFNSVQNVSPTAKSNMCMVW